MNYFELFDLPLDFILDTQLLAERYRRLQSLVHPDKFAHGSAQERLLAVQKAAQINDGFQTLKDPISRAEHILSLRGIELSHETRTINDGEFLMQQMHWREALADIAQSQDPQATIDELAESFALYQASIDAKQAPLLQSELESDWLQAADHIRKLKFMAKLQLELDKAQDALFD